MSDADSAGIEVQGLLICREVQQSRHGVSLREVTEVVPVLQFPGEAGPLTFVAFVRSARPGEASVSFRVHPASAPKTTLVTLPGRLSIQRGYEGRQTLVAAGFKSLKIHAGGWFGVEFRAGDEVLARTRFAVGAMGGAKDPA